MQRACCCPLRSNGLVRTERKTRRSRGGNCFLSLANIINLSESKLGVELDLLLMCSFGLSSENKCLKRTFILLVLLGMLKSQISNLQSIKKTRVQFCHPD